jgi:hypothetical protein
VNGTTIALHDAGDACELEYFHIKLQSHDIIDAEGAPCETAARGTGLLRRFAPRNDEGIGVCRTE